MKNRARIRRTSLIASMLFAPLLMAPGEPTCPACVVVLSGTLQLQELDTATEPVEDGTSYEALVEWTSGGAVLTVGGDVTNVSCAGDDDYDYCTFDAAADGDVVLKVTSTDDDTDFELSLGKTN